MNMDQTGVIFVVDGTDNIYEIKRAKQVLIHEKEEKRAFTTVLSMNFRREVLPT